MRKCFWNPQNLRCSTSVAIREIPTKITVRYCLTPIRMAIIQKTRNNKSQWGWREIWICVPYWWEHSIVWLLWKTLWQFLEKLDVELSYDPAIPLLKGIESRNSNRQLHTNVHTSIIHNSQKVEATQVSISRWIDKQNVVNTYDGIFFNK